MRKNRAGKEILILSFDFILTRRPINISNPSPSADEINKGLNLSPKMRPVAPKN